MAWSDNTSMSVSDAIQNSNNQPATTTKKYFMNNKQKMMNMRKEKSLQLAITQPPS